jgi:serine/threonine protein kinase
MACIDFKEDLISGASSTFVQNLVFPIMCSNAVKFDVDGKLVEIGQWLILQTIGVGATGKVKLAVNRGSGVLAAVKCLKKKKVDCNLKREVAIMKLLDEHEHVLRLYDVVCTDTHLYIIMEYASTELFDYIATTGKLKPREAVRIFFQIVKGIAHCHARNIVHRDLKLENLLLDEFLNVKIADFGMACMLSRDVNSLLKTFCGSPHYASPEIFSGLAYDGKKSDVWSLGVVLYAMLTAQMPFPGQVVGDIMASIKSGFVEIPDFIPSPLVDLLRRMLTVNPLDRISVAEIMDHEVFLRFPCCFTSSSPSSSTTSSPGFGPIVDSVDWEIVNDLHILLRGEASAELDPSNKDLIELVDRIVSSSGLFETDLYVQLRKAKESRHRRLARDSSHHTETSSEILELMDHPPSPVSSVDEEESGYNNTLANSATTASSSHNDLPSVLEDDTQS